MRAPFVPWIARATVLFVLLARGCSRSSSCTIAGDPTAAWGVREAGGGCEYGPQWSLGPASSLVVALRGGGGGGGVAAADGLRRAGGIIASSGTDRGAAFDRLARQALAEGRHEWAMYLFRRCTDLSSNATSLCAAAQMELELRGDAVAAAELCRRALVAEPASAVAARLIARLHLLPGPHPSFNATEVQSLLAAALAADPADAESACLLLAMAPKGEAKSALGACRAAISRREAGPARLEATHSLANALRDRGQFRPAQEVYQQLLSGRRNPDVLSDLADLHLAKGDADSASEAYMHVLAASPAHPGAAVGLAGITGALGDGDAESLLRKAASLTPRSTAVHTALASLLGVRMGEWGAASLQARLAASIHPSSPDAWAWSGYAADLAGNMTGAEEAYRRQLQLLPSSPLALYNLASLLHRRRRGGDASEAQSLYTSALALGPSTARAPAATNLGLLLGRSPGGLEHLSMAYGLRPSHLPTITAYADALLDAGDAEGSVSLFHRAAKADPTSARAAVGHARALAASRGGAGEEVIRAYTNAVALSPGSPVALSGLGAALQDSGVGQGEARELYRRALHTAPSHAPALYGLALCAEQEGDAAAAESAYLSAAAADPTHTNAWNNLGRLRDVGGMPGAEEAYEKALGTDPAHVTTLYNYGSLLQTKGAYGEAEGMYRRALATAGGGGGLGGVLCNYGLLLEAWKKDCDGAEVLYKRALDIDPADAFTLSNYASMLADARGDAAGSMALHQRVLAVMPGDAATMCSMASLCQQRGERDRADGYFQDAILASPSHVTTLALYAQFLADEFGDKRGQRRLLQRVLEIDPGYRKS